MRIPGTLHDQTVTIVQVDPTGDTDDDGVPIATTVTYEWERVGVQQNSAAEDHASGRNSSVTTYRVAGPNPLLEPTEGDLIVWDGVEYSIDGKPDVRRGRHRINHTSLTIRRAAG